MSENPVESFEIRGENTFPASQPTHGHALRGQGGPYHFSWSIVLEIHSHVNFAGLLTSAHLIFILPFPPVPSLPLLLHSHPRSRSLFFSYLFLSISDVRARN